MRRVGGHREAEPPADELEDALRVAEVEGARRQVPGRGQRRSGEREAEAPPLVGRWCAGRAVALPDLEDGNVVPADPQVRGHDLEQAADEALAEHGMLARQRVRDDDRPAGGALLGLVLERAVIVRRKPFD